MDEKLIAPKVPLGSAPRNQWQVSATHADLVRPPVAPRPITVTIDDRIVTFDLSRTAIIIVDMQNDFCHPDGWLASIGVDVAPARAPIAPLAALLPRLRAAEVPVIWVNWGVRPDRLNLSPALRHVYDPAGRGTGLGDPLARTGAHVLQAGSWSAGIVDELEQAAGDIHVRKHRMSGFWDTPLDAILRNLRLDTLLFAGVNLDQCVLHTLADANFLGYDTILVEDCAATTNPDYCRDATLLNIRQIFGFTLHSSALLEGLPA
jgi:nicotinamidase-related amidase